MEKHFNYEIDVLYKKYVNMLFSYAINLGFERDTSMDAIHDVFYKLCTDKSILNKVENIKFYLMSSLKNRLINIYKQSKEREDISDNSIANDILPFTINISIEDDIIEAEEEESLNIRLKKLLDSLTDREREIIYLRYMHEYSYEEISNLMNISVSSSRKLVHKALSRLRNNSLFALSLFFRLIAQNFL
jgi:RNA polymerase sigma factor (sigma-70 family)